MYGCFKFNVQRYKLGQKTSDFFSDTGIFQENLRSERLNRYIYKYIQHLSYPMLSSNLLEVCQISLSSAGLQTAIVKTAKTISIANEGLIAKSNLLPLPPISPSDAIDLYAPNTPETADVTLFYDGIGVKRQNAIRKDNPNAATLLPLLAANSKLREKVNTDIAVLELPNGEFIRLTQGLPRPNGKTYTTIDMVKHQLKANYGHIDKPLQLVAITDGATNIRTYLTKDIANHVCIILDWYHLAKKIVTLLSMILAGSKIEKQAHVFAIQALLWRGKKSEAIQYITNLKAKNKTVQTELISYLIKHDSEIIDYHRRQLAGRTIGSGRGEKANDQAIAHRQKKKGMAWTDSGSKALAILSASYT